MKVQTIQRRINRGFRYLAICGAVLMGVGASQAMAQSPLMNYLSNSSGDQAAGPGGQVSQQSSVRQVSHNGPAIGHAGGPTRQFNHEGQAIQVVSASQVKTAADLRGPIGSAVHGQRPVQQTSCNSCGNASCGGQCGGGACYSGQCGGQCSSGACGYNSYDMGGYGDCYGCGTHCDPYCYGMIEGLYWRREGDRRVFYSGGAFARSDWDFEFAPRITIGSLPDCVHGCEAVFMGVFEWDRFERQVATDDFLPPVFTAGDALIALDPDALNPFTTNVLTRNQRSEAELWSIEGSKTLVGWDVAKLLVGFRYLQYEEEFRFTSTNRVDTNTDPLAPPVLVDTTGQIYSEVINRLAGLQVGMDLLYPIGRFAFADFRSRAGIYANFAEGAVSLSERIQNQPAGRTIFANFDERTDIAGIFEVGGGVRYQLGEILSVRGGVDLMYIPGIGEAVAQIPGVITPFVGRRTNLDQDLFFWGLSFGGEIRL